MSAERAPAIGILGGMGPDATVELMRRVVAATPAADDCDHVHMIVDSNPHVPSRIKALVDGTGEDPAPELARMARRLVGAGAQTLAIACNTAHAYLPRIREAAGDVPVLDMIALTAARIAARTPAPARVGLLASSAVQSLGLYARAFEAHGIECVFPERQAEVLAIIKTVKRNEVAASDRAALAEIASSLVAGGADPVCIACTEISYIADALPPGIAVVDAMDVLVEEIVTVGRPERARA